MYNRLRRSAVQSSLVAACVVALILFMVGGVSPRMYSAFADSAIPSATIPASSILTGNVRLNGEIPAAVSGGQAQLVSAAAPAAPMTVNVGLPYRNQAALTSFLANQASHGIYLTQAQFDAEFAPTAAQVQAVENWAAGYGLTTVYTGADGILISMRGSTSAVESAFAVQINNYQSAANGVFYSASSDPVVPASLGINSIIGLDDIAMFHTLSRQAVQRQMKVVRARAAAGPSGGLYPSDFRSIYDVGHGYDGTGQVIGFTLWGAPVSQTDLTSFATNSGEPAMSGTVFNPSGIAPAANAQPTGTTADQIDWVYTNGVDATLDAQSETAMDIEETHGMAPHAHLVYYLGNQTGTCPSCGGSDTSLQVAINLAANNPLIHVVSDSWGGSDISNLNTTYASSTDQSFQHADAVGTTFYFSSGDAGSDAPGSNGTAEYPASSPYVVAVGGTTLTTNGSDGYGSESVWHCMSFCSSSDEGAGAGCAAFYTQPSWQNSTNVNTAENGNCAVSGTAHRFEPDVAADADPETGAEVYYTDNSSGTAVHTSGIWGGTSLATPLWAGMAAVADRYAVQNGVARIGWAAPKIYALASNSSKYALDYHDIPVGGTTNGSIVYATGAGWDEATGWGSIDWWNWVRDMVPIGTTVQTVSIPVTAGWNLIALPLSPTTTLDAQTVLTNLISLTGGGYTEIDSYTNGQFTPSLFDDVTDGIGVGGMNFTLQLGRGYALYSDRAGSISITGTLAPAQSVALSSGWNLAGFPDAAASVPKAYDVLSTLLAQTHGGYAEIDGYANGQFTPSAFDDPADGLGQGGTNFTIGAGRGYALYTDRGTTQSL